MIFARIGFYLKSLGVYRPLLLTAMISLFSTTIGLLLNGGDPTVWTPPFYGLEFVYPPSWVESIGLSVPLAIEEVATV